MARLTQTQFHKVFLAEQEGNTLVVMPRGDAVGFRDSDVADELKTVTELAGSPGIINLVVDLGSSDYFGSTMIGAINQLGTRFRYIGGRIALCNVSPQMKDMLEIMHLNDVWMIFDTRKDRAARDEQDLTAAIRSHRAPSYRNFRQHQPAILMAEILLTTLNARYAHCLVRAALSVWRTWASWPTAPSCVEFVARDANDRNARGDRRAQPAHRGDRRLHLERRGGHAAGRRI